MPAVLKEAKQLGLDEDKIVLDRTVMVPGFTLEKYNRLRHSQLSILSHQCTGGYLYNTFNLLVIAYTTNPDVLADFDKLPYAKKACFVPFKTKLYSGFYVPPECLRGRFLGEAMNEIAGNVLHLFNLWDLLLYGKKTPINQ